MLLISCHCYWSNSNTKYTRRVTWLRVDLKSFVCAITQNHGKSRKRRKSLVDVNIPIWIYDGSAISCTHCGPALDLCPWSSVEILCVCGHCSHGSHLGGCDHNVGHSGPCVHGNNLLAASRQSLHSPEFQSQMSLAWRGLDSYCCDVCDVGLRRRNKVGFFDRSQARFFFRLGSWPIRSGAISHLITWRTLVTKGT